MMFKDTLEQAASAYGLELSAIQLEQFARYYELLIEWNEKMNLTALTSEQDVAVKHFIDSLTAYDAGLMTDGARMIDVGTGAGFPGLPLKIFVPRLRLTLLDSLGKRVKFLTAVADELGLTGIDIIHGRAEDLARDRAHREQYDIAVSRAVARLSVLAEYTLPFVKVGGHLLALKGRDYAVEEKEAHHALGELGGATQTIRPVHLPGLDDVRAIIDIVKQKSTPKAFPRKAGVPTKKPL